MSILLATCIGPGKEYCLPFLPQVVARMGGVGEVLVALDGNADDPRIGEVIRLPETRARWASLQMARIARVREAIRRYFLVRSRFTHLYFHDADMIPPSDTVPRLLARGSALTSGIYNQRDWKTTQMPGAPARYDDGRIVSATTLDEFERGPDTCVLAGYFGMGCMLIERRVLETVPWRTPGWLFDRYRGEDIQFCADAFAACFGSVTVDASVSAWHASDDGTANRLVLRDGNDRRPYAVRAEPGIVSNRYGAWHPGVRRYDLTSGQMATLGPGFECYGGADLFVESARTSEIIQFIAENQ